VNISPRARRSGSLDAALHIVTPERNECAANEEIATAIDAV
jgi:hypothetical protein